MEYSLKRFLFFSVIFSIVLTSCTGQERIDSTVEVKDPSNATAASIGEFKDPMFFIEDQLCQHVRKIFQDQSGNLWFGTNVYGLMRYDGDTLEYFDKEDGVAGGRITGIVEDAKGNIWFGTYSGLLVYDGSSFSNLTEEDGLLDDEIWSLVIDRGGNIWIGTNKGVSIFDGNTFATFQIPKPDVMGSKTIYAEDRIVSIVEDHDGHIWFGTDGFGIGRYDGESFANFTTEDGLCGNVIHELMVDEGGRLWIGTYYCGLSMYDGDTFTNFTADGEIEGVEVGGFFQDNNRDIWFAAENNGVYRYRDGSFTNYFDEEGLPTNGILTIYRDREDRFWLGGWGGLFRYKDESFFTVTSNGPWSE